VVGFDDQELIADALMPGLTTVALPHYAMGEWAARTLLRIINGEAAAGPDDGDASSVAERHVVMPCPLVPRRSVGPPPR
jgi:LacI family transcriptional regulator